jgi:TonB-dependent receptor
MNYSKTTLKILYMLTFFAAGVFAQSGNVAGKVTDASDGSPLWGTNIILVGTSNGTSTNTDGKYRLSNIPEGPAIIVFRYLGYASDSVKVNIAGGKTIQLNVELHSLTLEGEEVIVSAQLQGQAAAINQQLSSNTIVNVVSSDKIQELPDANVAESLGRLPGIAIQRDAGEATKVVVRGLPPKFSSITINGERIPATDPNDRSVDLSMISQDILAGIEVFKSITPNMDADAIGGTINLVTKNAPENFHYNILAQGGYNNQKKDYGNYKFDASVSDRFFNNSFGVLATLSTQRANRSSDILNADYDPPTQTATLIEIENLNLGNRDEIRTRFSGGLNFDYTIGDLNLKLNNFYSQTGRDQIMRRKRYRVGETRVEYDLKDEQINTSVLNTGLIGNYLLGPLQIDWQGSYSVSKRKVPYSNYARFEEVSAYKNGLIRDQGPAVIPQFADNDLSSTWFQYGTFNPESVKDENTTFQFNLKVPFSLSSDLAGYLRGGTKYRGKHRVRDINEYRTDFGVVDNIAAANPGRWSLYRNTSILIDNFLDPSFSAKNFLNNQYDFGPGLDADLLDQFHSEFTGYYGLNRSVETGDYDASEKVYAAYIMAEVNIFKDIMILPGIRYEKTNTSYDGLAGELKGNLGQIGALKDTVGGQDYKEFFPNVHLRYRILDGLDAKLGYTESISRPDYFDLVPYEDVNTAEETVSRGNPDLKHTTAKNYDVTFSLYNRYGLFTAGGYYKSLANVAYQFTYRETDPASRYKNYTVTEPINSLDGKVYGLEIDLETNFSFFPSPFNGVILNLNFTKIHSETYFPYFEIDRINGKAVGVDKFRQGRLPGQPNTVWNLTVGYEKDGFSGRISFLHQDDALYSVGVRSDDDHYTDSFLRVDASLSQKIFKAFRVFLNLNNITNTSEGSFYYEKIYPVNEEYFGWTVDLGAKVDF